MNPCDESAARNASPQDEAPRKRKPSPRPVPPQKLAEKIRREYERIAFGGDEDVRTADRIRVMELLREIAIAEDGGTAAPLRVEIVYPGAEDANDGP